MSLRIYSVNGRKLINKKINNVKNDLNIKTPTLSKGVYLLRIMSGKQNVVQERFIYNK